MKRNVSLSVLIAAILLAAPVLVQGLRAQPGPHRIDVTAKRFEFLPGQITLKRGEPIVLVFKSVDVAHGIRFKELGIEAKIGKGQTSELAFIPDKTGTFVGHCSVFCGTGHGTMTLTLHVVD